MLAGGTPWEFLLEVLLRASFTYLLLLLGGMRETVMARAKVYAALRGQGVEHLGQLRRVYPEPSGGLSLIKYRRQRPGLLIIPESDSSHGRYERAEDHYACSNCGNVVVSDHEPLDYCDSCGEPRWTEAVTEAGAGGARPSQKDPAGLARKAG